MSSAGECVRDAMHSGVVSCAPDLALPAAVRLMADAQVRALIVIDSDCGLAGIVSQTDLVNATLAQSQPQTRLQTQHWQGLTVRDVMTPDVLTVTPDVPLAQAAKLMVDHHVHRLVVVDNSQAPCKPVGVLSMGDIVRGLSKE